MGSNSISINLSSRMYLEALDLLNIKEVLKCRHQHEEVSEAIEDLNREGSNHPKCNLFKISP